MSQTKNTEYGPLILGGTGRMGRMLAALWPQNKPAPLWQRRAAAAPLCGDDMIWDILAQDAPALPRPVSAVIVLAGVLAGTQDQLAQNTTLAQAGCRVANDLGVRALVASSQAIYGHTTGVLPETTPPQPANLYGQAKWDMEQAIAAPNVTCLRLGNVAGSDGLSCAMERGPVRIDQFADGQAPRRMMIGSRDLADILAALCDAPDLPSALNIASPNLIGMDAMADAAGVTWDWQPAPDAALPVLAMDVSAVGAYVALPEISPAELVSQARAGGWGPAA